MKLKQFICQKTLTLITKSTLKIKITTTNLAIYISFTMILTFISQKVVNTAVNYKFASAAAAAIDYYSLLGVERGATKQQIEQAFKRLTGSVNPDSNFGLFSRLSQAFVILTDHKARDAYDSLARSRKVSYINDPVTKPMTPSYIAERKAAKSKQWSKMHNLDQFGRYRGGVPNPNTLHRGKSKGEIGELHHKSELANYDQFPQFTQINQETAESFKNYHEDERENRTTKRPWVTYQVDYGFFTPRRILDKYRLWKYFLFITLIMPTLVKADNEWLKKGLKWMKDRKQRLKQEKIEHEAKEKLRLENEAREAEQKKKVKQAEALAAQTQSTQVQHQTHDQSAPAQVQATAQSK